MKRFDPLSVLSQPATEYHNISAAETASLIRDTLKRQFPGQKFSVTSDTYSGGASCRINWIDGPTTDEVDAHVKIYAGATFDGMTDSKSYHRHWLLPDGSVTLFDKSHPTPPKPGSRKVSLGADFVFTERQLSPDTKAQLIAELEQQHQAVYNADRHFANTGEYGAVMLHRHSYSRSFYQTPAPAAAKAKPTAQAAAKPEAKPAKASPAKSKPICPEATFRYLLQQAGQAADQPKFSLDKFTAWCVAQGGDWRKQFQPWLDSLNSPVAPAPAIEPAVDAHKPIEWPVDTPQWLADRNHVLKAFQSRPKLVFTLDMTVGQIHALWDTLTAEVEKLKAEGAQAQGDRRCSRRAQRHFRPRARAKPPQRQPAAVGLARRVRGPMAQPRFHASPRRDGRRVQPLRCRTRPPRSRCFRQ